MAFDSQQILACRQCREKNLTECAFFPLHPPTLSHKSPLTEDGNVEGNGCGRSSGVEHNLAKVRVVSSNLIARSKYKKAGPSGSAFCFSWIFFGNVTETSTFTAVQFGLDSGHHRNSQRDAGGSGLKNKNKEMTKIQTRAFNGPPRFLHCQNKHAALETRTCITLPLGKKNIPATLDIVKVRHS